MSGKKIVSRTAVNAIVIVLTMTAAAVWFLGAAPDASPAAGLIFGAAAGLMMLAARVGARLPRLATLTGAALVAARAVARMAGLPAWIARAAAQSAALAADIARRQPEPAPSLPRLPSHTLSPRILPIPR